MEQFLSQVRNYAEAIGVKPSTVIQKAGGGGGATWGRWESGESSPTLHTVDKIRKHMADNPPPAGGAVSAEVAA
ncbi:hypothetical protein PhaeoP66_04689 (plasmid) [Phaeobacter inhibens]|uniref:HTH cro/C1-type domain-containing protein n=1 Tax=Phaeobacter inhibens TaxID=221822 RepID=A0ABM6RBT2_9RHOB|nr:helix-turn-helix transcriptional regulator [Phaeobacter inhibens]AUQ93842.1 hypothetical protein PhaeoP66_01038 [Phaeobacter inhibens]AUQ97415.1 hypothetical protein PhaeoP66_04689 [Phaeobacter inhibens]